MKERVGDEKLIIVSVAVKYTHITSTSRPFQPQTLLIVVTGVSLLLHHHHHHFICPGIQQYEHLHQYSLEEQDSKVRQEH